MLPSLPCFQLLVVLLSLYLVTFLMLFIIYVPIFSTQVLLEKSTNTISSVMSPRVQCRLYIYWLSHDHFVHMHTNNKMEPQVKPYISAALEHFVRFLESCNKVIG